MNTNTYDDLLIANREKWETHTPCFIISERQLNKTIETIKGLFPGEVVYSQKTNPHPFISEVVNSRGCGFLLSSIEESETLVNGFGISAEKLIFQSPSLTVEQYKRVKSLDISRFIVDSEKQLEVIMSSLDGMARKPEILVRINTGVRVANSELCYSTDSYLGFPVTDATPIFKRLNVSREKGDITLGLHNHLLSQNTFLDLWRTNLDAMADYTERLHKEGVTLDTVDFGGGYPIYYGKPIPEFREIADLIKKTTERMKRAHPGLHFIIEPGRKVVGESITLVTEVVHTKEFRKADVAILNCSVYNASMDTLIVSLCLPAAKVGGNGKTSKEYVIRGSTPDSLDVFAKSVRLPELKPGDHIAFFHAGAYSFWSDFISLKKPQYLII